MSFNLAYNTRPCWLKVSTAVSLSSGAINLASLHTSTMYFAGQTARLECFLDGDCVLLVDDGDGEDDDDDDDVW